MSDKMNQHPCKYATYERKNDMYVYVCALTNKGCSAQYYCHEQKKWRPTQNIKCKNFERDDSASDKS